jgi:hypothetical protein
MRTTFKIFIIVALMIAAIVILMILSNEYLRDAIFGANIILWPLSYIVITIGGIEYINKFQNYRPSILKSLPITILVAVTSSFIFAIYWDYGSGFNEESLIRAIQMSLPTNLVLAIIIGLFYQGARFLTKEGR